MSEKKDSEDLNEGWGISLTGKLFLASVGAWIVGKNVNTKIRGNRDEVEAICNALAASKKFQDELRKPGATIESVVEKLRIKQMTASEFERVLGVRWPL